MSQSSIYHGLRIILMIFSYICMDNSKTTIHWIGVILSHKIGFTHGLALFTAYQDLDGKFSELPACLCISRPPIGNY